ncbi:MAG: HAMP domain-containing methyl-accepting chemotaxis protein [Christensenellales bacterium]|jgi:methyl-accepting chemotaxis protein
MMKIFKKRSKNTEQKDAKRGIGQRIIQKFKKDMSGKKRSKKRFTLFRNMRIAVKIVAGFFIIAFVGVGMGVYATLSLQEVGNASKTMYANILLPSRNIADVSTSFQKECVMLRQSILLEQDDSMLPALITMIKNKDKEVVERLSSVKSLISQDKMEALEKANSAYAAYQPLLEKAIESIETGNKDWVVEDLAGYGELRDAESAMEKAVESLMFAVTGDSAALATSNNMMAESVFRVTIILTVVVVVLSALIGFFTAKGISHPIKKLTQNAKLLAAGNMNIEAEAGQKVSKDEVGQIQGAFGTILQVIKELESDTDMLIGAAMEGRLTVRADAERHQGTYRRIVEGINATLDAVIEPIRESSDVLGELSKGNLDVRVTGDFKGDFALIKYALNNTIETLKGYISDITYVLGELAKGVLTVRIESEYMGDFAELKASINKSIKAFNSVLNDINAAAEEVSVGTEQVSGSSQVISKGSLEQAGALEELTQAIAQIADQTKKNAESANTASRLSQQAKDEAENGNEKMKALQSAMQEINESSASISKIIKAIDDIAFQTNILALNAAVEAARAGAHGRGFAVVAEEVRNLAARSATAAQETTDLIDASIKKTRAGTELANVTADALSNIVNGVEKTVSVSGEIAAASEDQAAGIDQINKGIVQLSAVVQNNSATAEQMAASSQEISGQAIMLKDMVGKFQLQEQTEKTDS